MYSNEIIMRYAKEQRLRFIDFLVDQYGYINRSALVDFFDIGLAMATRDFAKYRAMAPGNLVYDTKKKTYLKSPNFKCIWN